jgi:DNA modification methylase
MTKIIIGDSREELKKLPSNHFHCIVTSPPYYGQRNYGTAEWIGGHPECDHIECEFITSDNLRKDGRSHVGLYDNEKYESIPKQYVGMCQKCGATSIDNQIGIENTPEEYTETLVQIFSELRRVLRPDGSCWLVIGDCYNNYRPGTGALSQQSLSNSLRDLPQQCNRRANKHPTLKEKDLIGIPWMVAFALRNDGWYLRSATIWHKNGIPESVKDRPTSTYENVFLLTKESKYFYDDIAIQEPVEYKKDNGIHRFGGNKYGDNNDPLYQTKSGNAYNFKEMRNKRNIWRVPTQAFSGDHFATFPINLIDPMLKAGTSELGCCTNCGAPQERNPEDLKFYPSCSCNAPYEPCRVLDPFGGSGTTGEWCYLNNRDCTLIELNPNYKKFIYERSHIKEQELFKYKNVLSIF